MGLAPQHASALPRHLQQHVLQPAGEPWDAGRGLRHEPGAWAQRELLDLKEQVGAEGVPPNLPPLPPLCMSCPPLLPGLELHGRSILMEHP